MTIIGISASGREQGITSEVVKAVLEATGEPHEYISLAGLQIGGCIGCTRCAADSRCKVEDDWLAIGDKMLAAEAIVFGAPNYYGTINALGHACWERTFCFRHREVFRLAGKLGVAIGVGYEAENLRVMEYIRQMMGHNMMAVVGTVCAAGYSQCYTCGFGQDCAVGSVVRRHGFLDAIEAEHLPPRFAEQEEASFQAYRVGKTLGSILRARSEESP
jgi:multimeric flavodoxin WrbA